jgi:hypothetical protein
MPALGISLLLLAVGAILTFALTTTVSAPVEVTTIGVILMIVGGIGILMALLFMMSFSPFGSHDSHTTTHIDA